MNSIRLSLGALSEQIRRDFSDAVSESLNLTKMPGPLFVPEGNGLQDELNGVEEPVRFTIASQSQVIVHSLAKWKRYTLRNYKPGSGIITDMRAIRKDEVVDCTHSIYVDQWDWEHTLDKDQRTEMFLLTYANKIYNCILDVCFKHSFPAVDGFPPDLFVISSQKLLEMYPDLSPQERENEITKKHKAVFVMGIGGVLSDGNPHDGRAPDYDDWTTKRDDGGCGLNGDIIIWNPILGKAFEISSMGIRVDKQALKTQMKGKPYTDYHRMIEEDVVPLTIGGGIGQSRVCMFILGCLNIKDVQGN